MLFQKTIKSRVMVKISIRAKVWVGEG